MIMNNITNKNDTYKIRNKRTLVETMVVISASFYECQIHHLQFCYRRRAVVDLQNKLDLVSFVSSSSSESTAY